VLFCPLGPPICVVWSLPKSGAACSGEPPRTAPLAVGSGSGVVEHRNRSQMVHPCANGARAALVRKRIRLQRGG
jgi:hypothetical protein